MTVEERLRFKDLQEKKIVTNWPQLKRLVEEHGFPPGRIIGPNTRVWTPSEINEYLELRPMKRESRGE